MKAVFGTVIAFVVLVLLVVLAGLVYMYSGAPDVSAKSPDNPVVSWVLRTTREHSIENRTADVPAPPDLSDAGLVHAGAKRYREDCSACHGSPGDYPGPVGKGLSPKPPKLSRFAPGADPRVLYWVVMHGIKMTGMPSWHHEYSPDDAWSVVAFIRALPTISPEQYRQMTAAGGANEEHDQGAKPSG